MLTTLEHADEEALAAIREEMQIRKTTEVFLLLSLGSQFDHLIAQMLAKLGVFCLVANPSTVTLEDVLRVKPIGIILSGGPSSAHAEPPPFDSQIFSAGIPILGICLGFQLWAQCHGFSVTTAEKREFGVHTLTIRHVDPLFHNLGSRLEVLESHGDRVEPAGNLVVLASTDNAPVAAARYQNCWGVQFHPEVTHTPEGEYMLSNFCFRICQAQDRYPAGREAERKVSELRQTVGTKRVILALSGGSDSSVVAHLLRKAKENREGEILAVYIRGIDRPDDEAYVRRYFSDKPWLKLRIVDATYRFLEALRGKISMKEKRIAMRGVYKEVLEAQATYWNAEYIAQGTLYTDISESGGGYATGARKAQIKLHHNINLGFAVAELTPLDDCVKDGARNIGRQIGVPEELLVRHPFPGPGLVVRIEGEITAERLAVARQVDGIYIEELRAFGLYESVWQAGGYITQSTTTCSKGDDATTGIFVILWAVWSVNGFTASSAELSYEFLKHVSRRITNEIRAIGAVTYRLSDKPPATIECG